MPSAQRVRASQLFKRSPTARFARLGMTRRCSTKPRGQGAVIHFEKRDGVYYAPTKIDESTVMPVLEPSASSVQLNMSLLKTINSYGTRKLVNFVRAARPIPVDYIACPSVFVDTLNIVRDLLGDGRDPRRVKSYCIPYFCEDCSLYQDVLANYDDVRPDEENLGLKEQHCIKCGNVSLPDVEASEFLAFIMDGRT